MIVDLVLAAIVAACSIYVAKKKRQKIEQLEARLLDCPQDNKGRFLL